MILDFFQVVGGCCWWLLFFLSTVLVPWRIVARPQSLRSVSVQNVTRNFESHFKLKLPEPFQRRFTQLYKMFAQRLTREREGSGRRSFQERGQRDFVDAAESGAAKFASNCPPSEALPRCPFNLGRDREEGSGIVDRGNLHLRSRLLRSCCYKDRSRLLRSR